MIDFRGMGFLEINFYINRYLIINRCPVISYYRSISSIPIESILLHAPLDSVQMSESFLALRGPFNPLQITYSSVKSISLGSKDSLTEALPMEFPSSHFPIPEKDNFPNNPISLYEFIEPSVSNLISALSMLPQVMYISISFFIVSFSTSVLPD